MIFSFNKVAPKTFPFEINDFSLFVKADEFRHRVIEQIQQAQHRIYICALYLQQDDVGREILSELYKAKSKNPALNIKIFVDYHRSLRGLIGEKSANTNRDCYLEFAKRHQVEIEIYGVPVKRKELFGVLHLKGFVFDDTVLYSGASINNVYFQFNEKYRCDRYYEFNQPLLANSLSAYLDLLISRGEIPRLNKGALPAAKQLKRCIKQVQYIFKHYHYQHGSAVKTNGTLTIQPLLGFGQKRNNLNDTIRKMIQKSTDSLVIFTPYFNLPKPLLADVKKALKRGVNVSFIIGDKTANDFFIADPDDFSTIGIVPYIYELLLKKFIKRFQRFIDNDKLSIKLWQHNNNSFHLKGVVSDNQWHLVTGNNLNPRAWRLDVENGLLIHDKQQQLTPFIAKEMQQINQHTRNINSIDDIEHFDSYPTDVKKLLKNIQRSQLSRILQRFL